MEELTAVPDMPTQLPDNLALAAILEREDPRDALIVSPKLPKGTTLKDLPEGSTIGTSSVRRAAQLRRLYPSFNFIDLRGNVGTRLAKLDAEDSPYTAIILAAAGLKRLGWDDRIAQYLSSDSGGMLHAVGQGALAIEIRKGDADVSKLVDHINCERTSRACSAERGLLRALEGGCSVPIGVETTWRGDGGNLDEQELVMKTLVVSVDGKEAVEYETARKVKSTEDAVALGKEVAKVLVEKGADKILEKISTEKQWAAKKQLEQMEETS
jgi:hydroxymethylbilane synthase